MPAARYDITCEQGAVFAYDLPVNLDDGDDNPNNDQPADLTGWTAKMQVRPSLTEPPLIELTTQNGRLLLNEGKVKLRLNPPETASLNPKFMLSSFPLQSQGIYDLFLTSPGGTVIKALYGRFDIIAAITR